MRSPEALRALAEITASQWGMVTTAQASARGVDRLTLSRLAENGHLVRLGHGLYMDAGAPPDPLDDLRAAWLSTEPRRLGEERIRDGARGVIVASSSAARLHEIGDFWADRHEFVAPNRRQTQRPELRYRVRKLDERDVTLVAGLPVMTIERTIVDLVEEIGDLSLAADALRDAAMKRVLDSERLKELLAPHAHRHSLPRGDGAALLERLSEIAGIDRGSIARQVAQDAAIATQVTSRVLESIDLSRFSRVGEAVAKSIDTEQLKALSKALGKIASRMSIDPALRSRVTLDPQLLAAYRSIASDLHPLRETPLSPDAAPDEARS